MGYNLNQRNGFIKINMLKVDLKVMTKDHEYKSKICTHRPSLSSKDEKSRNKVDITEVVSVGI